jgi:amino acid transporter
MNFAAMKSEVRRRLAEHGGPVYWTDAEIGAALNAGYMEASDATEWHEGHVSIALTSNRIYYDLRSCIGESFLAVRPSFDPQTNRWLIPSAVREMDARDRRWEMSTGEPQRFFTRGLWWLGLWPSIQTETGVWKQYYASLPDPLVDDDDQPGFPGPWHMIVVNFAMTELWAMDGETAFALAEWKLYLDGEGELQQWVDKRGGEAEISGFLNFGDGLRR